MSNLLKLQQLCRTLELDGILLTGEVNRQYATGMHSSAGAVLVVPSEGLYITDFRYIEIAKRQVTDYTVSMNTREAGGTIADILKTFLEKHGVKRLGYEQHVQTVSEFNNWQEKLTAEWVPVQDGLARLRASKESNEILCMTKAQRIAERALTSVLDIIQVGMTERQIAAELIYHMLKFGADKLSFDPIVVAGPNSSLPHGEPGDRPIQNGDFLTMDFGCMVGGYCSDMTRTVAIGEPSAEMRKVYEVVQKAQLAGIAVAKAGVVGHTIHDAAAKVIADAGYGDYFGHGFGHGIGLEVHEEYSASPSEKRALPVGAAISAEPGIYISGKFGVRIEDVIVLSEDGSLNLMEATRELVVICQK